MVVAMVEDRSADIAIPEMAVMTMAMEPMSTKVTAGEVTTTVPPPNFGDVSLRLLHLR
jgi:hypothetical protein